MSKKSHSAFKQAAIGATLALIATFSVGAASAQAYDGYCYQKNSAPRTKGTVIGGLAGAAVGNIVAGNGNKTEGTVLGAVVGAAIGNAIGNEQKKKDKITASANCYNGRYYVYNDGYYEPPVAPDGYRVAYFDTRPNYKVVYVRENGREEQYDRRRHGHKRH
jgi:uncharacterized protein YcfJ